MSDILNSYSKAFLDALKDEAIHEFLSKEEILKSCFKDQDFLEVLKNPFFESQKKLNFVLDVLSITNQDLKHALLVLAEAEKLVFLFEILKNIQKALDRKNKRCAGVLFSFEKIDPSLVALFKQELEKKIGYEINLEEKQWKQEGVKCCIDELHLEISFSQKGFVENLKNVILSSICERSVN